MFIAQLEVAEAAATCGRTPSECDRAQVAVRMLQYLKDEVREENREIAEVMIDDLIRVIGCCRYVAVKRMRPATGEDAGEPGAESRL